MARISDLVLRYLDRNAGSSGGSPIQYTCSSGTVRTAVSAALSGQSPANMSGAIVRWDTGTNATAHQWSAVYSYDDGSTTLTFDSDLPNAVVNNDQFTLISGGRWLTSARIPGLIYNGTNWPPAFAGIALSGMTVDYIAMLNSTGNGTLTYTASNGTAQWTPPGGTIGPAVAITGLSTGDMVTFVGGGVAIEDKSKFIVLQRNTNALPVGNTSDVIALTIPKGIHMMPLTGSETLNGIIIYRPVGIINTHASETIYNIRAFVPNPFTTAAQTTVTGAGIGVGADTLTGTSMTNWPTHCWVARVNGSGQVLDCRYCYDRSGNQMTVMDPAGGMRGFTAGSWSAGDNIVPMPWQDIALNAPVANEFANPATEQTVPAGTSWTQGATGAATPMSVDNALSAGDLASGAIYTVWERFVVPANMRPATSIIADLRVYAEVDQE